MVACTCNASPRWGGVRETLQIEGRLGCGARPCLRVCKLLVSFRYHLTEMLGVEGRQGQNLGQTLLYQRSGKAGPALPFSMLSVDTQGTPAKCRVLEGQGRHCLYSDTLISQVWGCTPAILAWEAEVRRQRVQGQCGLHMLPQKTRASPMALW